MTVPLDAAPISRDQSAINILDRDPHALDACARAAAHLKAMGFAKVRTAMVTESCYYVLPDHPGAVRVAAHRFGRTEMRISGFPVLALVTFGSNQGHVSDTMVQDRVAVAVGYYFWRRLNPAFRGFGGRAVRSPRAVPVATGEDDARSAGQATAFNPMVGEFDPRTAHQGATA